MCFSVMMIPTFGNNDTVASHKEMVDAWAIMGYCNQHHLAYEPAVLITGQFAPGSMTKGLE